MTSNDQTCGDVTQTFPGLAGQNPDNGTRVQNRRLLKAAKVVALYRHQNADISFFAGGYVLLWRMKATGWSSDLSDPNRSRPGAMAVSVTGQVFVATGGNYWNGATEWSLIYTPATVAPSTAV